MPGFRLQLTEKTTVPLREKGGFDGIEEKLLQIRLREDIIFNYFSHMKL